MELLDGELLDGEEEDVKHWMRKQFAKEMEKERQRQGYVAPKTNDSRWQAKEVFIESEDVKHWEKERQRQGYFWLPKTNDKRQSQGHLSSQNDQNGSNTSEKGSPEEMEKKGCSSAADSSK